MHQVRTGVRVGLRIEYDGGPAGLLFFCGGRHTQWREGDEWEGGKCKSGGEEIQKHIISIHFFFYKCKLDI